MQNLIAMLAAEFVAQGHSVVMATETAGHADLPYPVHRAPGFREFVALARECDVILTAPLSLRRLPAQIMSGKPIVAAHPDVLDGHGLEKIPAVFKRLVARTMITNVVPSRYLAGEIPGSTVIENPFDTGAFAWPEDGRSRRDILFLGRLVRRKGCGTLIRAFALIAGEFPEVSLDIAGDGVERAMLGRLAEELGVADRVKFLGVVTGAALTELLQDHAIMAVPTVNREPFGIVALEGLASGCRMVVADSGGLPQAVGEHAILFERANVEACAAALRQALTEREPPSRKAVEAHLAQFRPERIAGRYLAVLEAAIG